MQTDVTAHADLISILTKLSNVFSPSLLLTIHSFFIYSRLKFNRLAQVDTHTPARIEWEAFKSTSLSSCRCCCWFLYFCSFFFVLFATPSICVNCHRLKYTGTITFGDVQKLNNIQLAIVFMWRHFLLCHACMNVCDCVCVWERGNRNCQQWALAIVANQHLWFGLQISKKMK